MIKKNDELSTQLTEKELIMLNSNVDNFIEENKDSEFKYLVFKLEKLECDEGRYYDVTTGDIYFGCCDKEISINDIEDFEFLYKRSGYKFTPLKLSKSAISAETSKSAYISLYFQEGRPQQNLLDQHPNMMRTALYYYEYFNLPPRSCVNLIMNHCA